MMVFLQFMCVLGAIWFGYCSTQTLGTMKGVVSGPGIEQALVSMFRWTALITVARIAGSVSLMYLAWIIEP